MTALMAHGSAMDSMIGSILCMNLVGGVKVHVNGR